MDPLEAYKKSREGIHALPFIELDIEELVSLEEIIIEVINQSYKYFKVACPRSELFVEECDELSSLSSKLQGFYKGEKEYG